MARRPADLGAEKAVYRQGDVLSFNDVEALARDADVIVHLAFIILGGREETRKVNLTGSRNVFAAAARHGGGSSTPRPSPPTASTPTTRCR